MGKASVKRYILSADLKEARVGETMMWEGNEFQRVGGQKLRRPDHPKSGTQSVVAFVSLLSYVLMSYVNKIQSD